MKRVSAARCAAETRTRGRSATRSCHWCKIWVNENGARSQLSQIDINLGNTSRQNQELCSLSNQNRRLKVVILAVELLHESEGHLHLLSHRSCLIQLSFDISLSRLLLTSTPVGGWWEQPEIYRSVCLITPSGSRPVGVLKDIWRLMISFIWAAMGKL